MTKYQWETRDELEAMLATLQVAGADFRRLKHFDVEAESEKALLIGTDCYGHKTWIPKSAIGQTRSNPNQGHDLWIKKWFAAKSGMLGNCY